MHRRKWVGYSIQIKREMKDYQYEETESGSGQEAEVFQRRGAGT